MRKLALDNGNRAGPQRIHRLPAVGALAFFKFALPVAHIELNYAIAVVYVKVSK